MYEMNNLGLEALALEMNARNLQPETQENAVRLR
jgi:hypothetical protein